MTKFKKFILFTAAFLFILSCSMKVEKSYNFEVIDEIMESAVTDSVFPGAALLFGIDQEILYSKAFGNFTYDKKFA